MKKTSLCKSALLTLLLVACGGEETGDTSNTGDNGEVVCRSFEDQAACDAAPDFVFEDGSYARCGWFEGSVFTRNGDSCSMDAGNIGICLPEGSTQMSCTFTGMDQTYSSCVGVLDQDDVPPYWVVTSSGETLLVNNLCGPTIKDDMSGRCGRGVDDDPPECECPCL